VAALLSVALAAGGGAVWLLAAPGMGGAVMLGAALHGSRQGAGSMVNMPRALAACCLNAAQRRSSGCAAAAAAAGRTCLTAAAAACATMMVCGCGWLWRRQCKGVGDRGAELE
jgi:hypothetical protein